MFRVTRVLAPLTIAAFGLFAQSAIGAKNEVPLLDIESNPAIQINSQVEAMTSQIALIQTSVHSLPINAVKGAVVVRDIESALETTIDAFTDEGSSLETTVLASLDKLNGRFLNIDTPKALSKEFLASLPTPRGDEEFTCLANGLYFEARGETLQGQRAVAEVILNRVASKQYPNTICGVVYQGTGKKHQCQFSFSCDGIPDVVREKSAFERSSKIARLMIDGMYKEAEVTDGALYYHTTAVRPSWAKSFTRTTQLGVHLFYR